MTSPGELEQAERLVAEAMQLHQSGRAREARPLYERAVALAPDHVDAHQYLGLALSETGETERGIDMLRRAVALAPGDAFCHSNLGVALLEAGDAEGALRAWREAVQLEPDDAGGHFHLGLVLGELDRWHEAVPAFRRAASLAPGDAGCRFQLGNALARDGQLESALAAYQEAIALEPAHAGAHRQSGFVLSSLGHKGEAERACRRAAELEPGHPVSHHNLGNVLLDLGRPGEARTCFERALALAPGARESRLALALAESALGRPQAAMDAYRRCLDDDAGDRDALDGLARTIARLAPAVYSPVLEQDLLRCFASDQVDWQTLARTSARLLDLHHALGRLELADRTARASLLDTLGRDPLWLAFLSQTVNVDADLERAIAIVRREVLLRGVDAGSLEPPDRALAAALALQAFANEHVIAAESDERVILETPWQRLTSHAPAGRERDLLLVAMYRDPGTLPAHVVDSLLAEQGWAADTATLVQRTLRDPRAERALASEIESVSLIDNPVSLAVREQYEDNPYPRWLSLAASAPTTLGTMLARRFPHYRPPPALHGPLDLLVAGCGTGREALDIARTCPHARVTGVDLSRASLAYGVRMAAKLGVEVALVHGDILCLDELGRTFPAIVSTGVLHHLDEPLRGWRVLASLLEPDGVMRVALYSRRARAPVEAARRLIAERGLEPTSAHIAGVRREIIDGRAGESCQPLRASDDLFTVSACRDLLFHVCERQFDPLGIRDALETLGLELIGLEIPDPATERAFRAAYPQPDAVRDLACWDAFEVDHPDAFVGMYHFWCRKRRDA